MDTDLFYKSLFESVYEQYSENQFCDLKILVSEDGLGSNLRPIFCHSVILCSVAPNLKKLLLDPDLDKEVEDQKCVLMPDITYEVVKTFVDKIYSGLSMKEIELELTTDLANVFAILTLAGNEKEEVTIIDDGEVGVSVIDEVTLNSFDLKHFEDNFEGDLPIITFDQGQLKDLLDKGGKIIEPTPAPTNTSTTAASLTAPSTPSRKRPLESISRKFSAKKLLGSWSIWDFDTKTPSPKRPGVKPVTFKAKAPVQATPTEPKPTPTIKLPTEPLPPPPPPARIIHGPFRYNPTLSQGKPTYISIKKMSMGFVRNFGLFRATTDAFYTSPQVIADKDNVLMVGDTPRQFRMKMPQKEFYAFVAVGLRNGENIVHTLATNVPTAIPQATVVNLITAAKNVCGISFGALLRHPRCSEVNRDKISRAAIDKFKAEYQKLTEAERTKIGQSHLKHLKEFDATEDKLELLHLPQKPIRMEFRLVSEIGREEIMDYAIVSGDKPRGLTIQSFVNLNYQKMPTNRLVTIFCDLISCFLGYHNKTPLTEYSYVKECFETYANRTCKLQACRELGMTSMEIPPDTDGRRSTNPNKRKRASFVRGPVVFRTPKTPKVEPPRNYACTEAGCTKTFAEEFHRQIHITRMHINPPPKGRPGVPRPPGCGRPAKPAEEAVEGTERVCLPCGKTLKDHKELKMHIYYHHNPKECKECNLNFPGAYHFYTHMRMKHTERVTCEICGKSDIKKDKLNEHRILTHVPDNERPFVCSFCGKGFAAKAKLESHEMNVHIRTRPYKCRLEGCSADFNEMANRNAHERTVHKYNYKEAMANLSQ